MFIAMFSHPDFAKTDFSHIRTGIMAGANCPPELMRRAAEEMHMTEILSVYGQTEAAPGCTMGEVGESLYDRTETVGTAFPGDVIRFHKSKITGLYKHANYFSEFSCHHRHNAAFRTTATEEIRQFYLYRIPVHGIPQIPFGNENIIGFILSLRNDKTETLAGHLQATGY